MSASDQERPRSLPSPSTARWRSSPGQRSSTTYATPRALPCAGAVPRAQDERGGGTRARRAAATRTRSCAIYGHQADDISVHAIAPSATYRTFGHQRESFVSSVWPVPRPSSVPAYRLRGWSLQRVIGLGDDGWGCP